MSKFEDAYWGKEIAEILQIGDSTLRKWCLSLENQGHIFMRGQHNSRAFVERDLLILRRMKELIQNKGITLETASEIVISRFNQTEGTASVLQNELLLDILERQERLEEQNKHFLLMLEEKQNYINNSLDKRDFQLMQALKESQETKKLIASTLKKKEFLGEIIR